MSDYRQVVQPGPCPPGGCPPPTEIDCIKVKKVYQECAEVELREVVVPLSDFDCNGSAPTPSVIADVRCLDLTPSALHFDGQCVIGNGTVTFNPPRQLKTVRVQFLDTNGNILATCSADINICITENCTRKTVRLSRAGEPGLECELDVFESCLAAFLSGTTEVPTVTLCISELMVIKLFAEVQILVPTYGFCPQPPECEQVLGECPTPTINWPPYPPQTLNGDPPDGGCGCG